jgi:two-component system sensor histidine kinase DegS
MELSVISNSLKDTINEIRDTIFELRPMSFDDLGFRDLLASYIEKEKENKNIKVIFNKYNLSITDQSYLIFIFRVIKECLGNSVKHSKCKEIQLVIDDSDGKNLIIEIIDDGTGFDVEDKNFEKNKHFGLIILRERVNLMQGNVEMVSNENGTKVHISVPLNIV